MDATEQITRHAVNIRAHRLLIQQILIQLQSVNPKIVQQIYENISFELRDQESSRSDDLKKFDAKVDEHVAEL
ncbi:MAG: hypothetical protein WBD95_02700, partial [Xanthobacteraceae bacterium]